MYAALKWQSRLLSPYLEIMINSSRYLWKTNDMRENENLHHYSMDSIIRPGCSRFLGFEKKNSTGCLIETFSKNLDHDV